MLCRLEHQQNHPAVRETLLGCFFSSSLAAGMAQSFSPLWNIILRAQWGNVLFYYHHIFLLHWLSKCKKPLRFHSSRDNVALSWLSSYGKGSGKSSASRRLSKYGCSRASSAVSLSSPSRTSIFSSRSIPVHRQRNGVKKHWLTKTRRISWSRTLLEKKVLKN